MDKTLIPTAKSSLSSKVAVIQPQKEFLQQIAQECRRAERSKQRFLLLLIDGFATRKADISSFAAPLRYYPPRPTP